MKTEAKGKEMPKLKLGEDGKPELQNGKLVLVLDDGKETEFDAVGVYSTLGKIREERDEWKGKAEATEAELAKFGKSAEDRNGAIEKLRLAGNLDAKKLIDAGEVDKLKNEAISEYKSERDKEVAELKSEIERRDAEAFEKDLDLLGRSEVLSEYVPTWSLLKHELRNRIGRDKSGRLVGFKDAEKKEQIYSASNPGHPPTNDELISQLLRSHPDHEKWKKSSQANGTGASGNPNPGGPDDSGLPAERRLARGLAKTA